MIMMVARWLQVPLAPRHMWRQRLRWLKGSHLYLIGPGSVFFRRQAHMSAFQKGLYWLCPVAHFIQAWAEPVMFTLPFLCLVLKTCPYGMDRRLFFTHIAYLFASAVNTCWYPEGALRRTALAAKFGHRVLWFTSVKAVANTLMVVTGWKNPGHFKFTPKTSLAAGGGGGDEGHTAHLTGALERVGDSPSPRRRRRRPALRDIHRGVSRVTGARARCLPMDGTLDVWVLMAVMALSLFSATIGLRRLAARDALVKWNEDRDALIWIGVVFAVADAAPGLLFLGCAARSLARPALCRAACAPHPCYTARAPHGGHAFSANANCTAKGGVCSTSTLTCAVWTGSRRCRV